MRLEVSLVSDSTKARKGIKDKMAWVRIILFGVLSAALFINSVNMKSPIVGIPVSLAFLFVCAITTGDVFFPGERRFLRQALGSVVFIMITALIGVSLILIVSFTETLCIICLAAVGLVLCLLSLLRAKRSQHEPSQLPVNAKKDIESYLLLFPFFISVVIAFYALLIARTGEGRTTVWLTIPAFFLPVFFVSTFSLVIMLFFTRMNSGLKLALTSLHSFLTHSVFFVVWYPGRYGDPWEYLGNARFIDNTGTFYAHEWLYSQRLVADIIKYEAQYSLLGFFRRMFAIDIYWVHVLFIPLLWSVFLPIVLYKIGDLLAAKTNSRYPLFCAFAGSLFSPLIYWGSISQAYSLGLLFLLCTVMSLLYWGENRSKRILLLSFLASVASLFAHPTMGAFALSFLLVGIILQSGLHRILKLGSIVAAFFAYPFVSYLQRATFSQEGILSLENLLSFQLDISTLLLVFGFLGFLFSIRGKLVKGRTALLLFVFYILLAVNYYVTMYGMKGAPVPGRLLAVADLLLVPFVVLGFIVTVRFLRHAFSQAKIPSSKIAKSGSLALLLVCVLLSALATSALYQAYPRKEITDVQPAAYELEAILYIDSVSEGRYVVLGDTNLATLAGAFLGVDYSYGSPFAKGNFGIAEWDWWSMKLYLQMTTNPSLSVLEEAMRRTAVGIGYFVVSVREPYYADIVRRTSEVLEANRTFGEGKLTLFRYTSSTFPITGSGPFIKVSFDGQPFTEAQTAYDYLSKSEVDYHVTFSGHSSYNITDFPTYWTFSDLTISGLSVQVSESSDVNTFVYVGEVDPNDELRVTWKANEYYLNAGWKEDSFKSGWSRHTLYAENMSAVVVKNGIELSISGDFTPFLGSYSFYYQSKTVNNLSTTEFPWILVKWKSTGPVAGVIIRYADGTEHNIVPTGSESEDWASAIVKLEPDKQIAWIIVGISNLPEYNVEGIQTLYIDYILICAP